MSCSSVDSCAFAPTSYKMDVISKYNLRPRKFINYNEDDFQNKDIESTEPNYIFTDKETLINDLTNGLDSASKAIGSYNKIKHAMYSIKLGMILIEHHCSLNFIETLKAKVNEILKESLIVGNNRDILMGYKKILKAY